MVEQLFGRCARSCGLVIGVAVMALALPMQASAATSTHPSLSTVSVKKAGFKLSMFASEKQAGLPASFAASLLKTAEFDSYVFSKGIKFTAKSNLSSAQLSGTFAMHRGSVKMSFHATKGATKIPLGKNCKGTPGKQRKGVLEGSFSLKADRLGKLKLSKIAATLTTPPTETCPTPPPPKFHGVSVSGFSSGTGRSLSVSATKPNKGAVSESVSESSFGTGWSFTHSIFVGGLASSKYTFSHNLSTAKVTGGSPLGGTANYKGTPAVSNFSSGTLNGNLTATFATVGKVKPFAHGALTASQSRS